jgi:hypothetical protein
MRRLRDPHDDPQPPRRGRERDAPAATLGQIHTEPFWIWIYCSGTCTHCMPFALAPFVIRFGTDASSDVLRRRARCSRCGHKGASLRRPSWINGYVGIAPFPTERR